jgi:hypothetical protein
MPIRVKENLLGARAFLIGIVLALIVGLFQNYFTEVSNVVYPFMLGILSLLGIIVGYSVSEDNAHSFLLASVSLVLVSYAGISGLVLNAAILGVNIGRVISYVLGSLLVLFVPATIVVAIKTVFSLSRMR